MVRIVSFFTLYELILAAMILIRQQVLMFRHLCLILEIGVSCLADSLHCPYRVILTLQLLVTFSREPNNVLLRFEWRLLFNIYVVGCCPQLGNQYFNYS